MQQLTRTRLYSTASSNFTCYGGRRTVTLIPGDGIGRELCNAVKTVFSAASVPVDFEQVEVSGFHNDNQGYLASIESIKRNKVALKGMFYTPKAGHLSFNVSMRKDMIQGRHSNVNFVVIRENTEGEYSGLEHQSVPGVIESLKVTTRAKSERICKFAFDYAIKNNRKKVTCVHKANIMKLTDGLFLNTFENVAKTFSSKGIATDNMIVDNTAMQLVSKPQQFDVIVTPNLYGNIVSNIGAGLVGGPGFIVGYNIGPEYATFEPGARHLGRSLEGTNSANPTSMLYSACIMLKLLGLDTHASTIEKAVDTVLREGKCKSIDMGGNAKTTDFCKSVIECLGK